MVQKHRAISASHILHVGVAQQSCRLLVNVKVNVLLTHTVPASRKWAAGKDATTHHNIDLRGGHVTSRQRHIVDSRGAARECGAEHGCYFR